MIVQHQINRNQDPMPRAKSMIVWGDRQCNLFQISCCGNWGWFQLKYSDLASVHLVGMAHFLERWPSGICFFQDAHHFSFFAKFCYVKKELNRHEHQFELRYLDEVTSWPMHINNTVQSKPKEQVQDMKMDNELLLLFRTKN